MKDQHTPGPWCVQPNGSCYNLKSPDRATHFAILVGMTHNHVGELEANARLIAAAPDMLALLRQCLWEHTEFNLVTPGTIDDIRRKLESLDPQQRSFKGLRRPSRSHCTGAAALGFWYATPLETVTFKEKIMDTEPDSLDFECHGLTCALRKGPLPGTWSGYVAIPPEHPLHGADDAAVEVHGGIAYADDHCAPEEPSDGRWWFGFDCYHICDKPEFGGTPRSLGYTKAECESLALQLSRLTKETVGK